MPIPIEVMRELMLNPISLACIKNKVVMVYLNAHPDQCELLLTDSVQMAFIVMMQAHPDAPDKRGDVRDDRARSWYARACSADLSKGEEFQTYAAFLCGDIDASTTRKTQWSA